MKARWRSGVCAALAVAPTMAAAQDEPSSTYDAQHFRPTAPGEPFLRTVTGSPAVGPSWGAGAVLHYALNPLRYREGDAMSAVVGSLWQLDLQGAATFGAFRAAVDLPVFQYGTSDIFDARVGLGNLWLEGRGSLLDRGVDPIGLGVLAALTLPTRTVDDALGTGRVGATVAVVADVEVGGVLVAGDLGMAFDRTTELGDVRTGQALLFGLAASMAVDSERAVSAELSLRSYLSNPTPSRGTPIELLLGGHQAVGRDMVARVGVGTSFTPAVGAPALRVVLSLERAPVDPDPDRDDLITRRDDCPLEAELFNGIRDDDGCPELDAVLGVTDPARGGKPVPPLLQWIDSDGDGYADPVDLCPDVVEDPDGFEDDDGCPEDDNDEDGVPDVDDGCPLEAETANGFEDDDGCPEEPPRGTGTKIEIARGIQFETDADTLRPSSVPILERVLVVIEQNPGRYVRIEGHTDDEGSHEYNLDLSARRNETVRLWLVEHGVADDVIVTRAYGEGHPIEANDTPAGRFSNRRVEIYLLGEGAR